MKVTQCVPCDNQWWHKLSAKLFYCLLSSPLQNLPTLNEVDLLKENKLLTLLGELKFQRELATEVDLANEHSIICKENMKKNHHDLLAQLDDGSQKSCNRQITLQR